MMKILRLLFFNKLTRLIQVPNKIGNNRNLRFDVFLLELIYPFLVLLPLILLVMFLIPVFYKLISGHDLQENYWSITSITIDLPFLMLYANKDYFNGQSIIHRTYGFQVVECKTNAPANELKCLIRNITCLLYPIEALFVIFNKQRRLGDFIAGTKLIEVEKSNPELILHEIKYLKMGIKSKIAILVPIFLVVVRTVWFWVAS